ncbi:serine protease spb1 [Bdellovibrio sp.]|uniref:serine protease spb1 n=1 Tax=Bdellovibrio TaxID=958 RepID=UPI003221A6D0
MIKALSLFIVVSWGAIAQAASCCGGSFSFPALILGDDKAQVTSTYSYSEITDDVLSSGQWMKRDDGNQSQTLKVEGALLLADSWQAGISVPVISKKDQSHSATSGVGDLSLYLGHETFPELQYSRWKPRGVTFLQVTLPTAPSIYDEDATNSNKIRGRGFTSLGAGLALVKTWRVWDANFSSEIHKSFERSAEGAAYNGKATVTPGWGTTQTLGVGWNKGDLRLGSNVSFLYEDAIQIRGDTHSTGQNQKHFTWGFSGSYMLSQESALTVGYSDQSLLGNPVNSTLSNTFSLSYQQRWQR